MSALIFHVFNDAHSDGSDATLVNPSNWNDGHKFTGGNNGAIPVRDTSDGTYGSSWLASVAVGQVVVSAGVGALPAWSADPVVNSMTLGTTPALSGTIRLGNNNFIESRNAANNNDIVLLNLDASNNVCLGDGNAASTWLKGAFVTIGPTNTATGGTIRMQKNATIVARNNANTANLQFWTMDASDIIYFGDDGSFATATKTVLMGVNNLIGWGGLTSSFPALKRSGTAFQARLADDSAYTNISAGLFVAQTAFVGPGTTAGGGDIRLQNGGIFAARNAANSGDVRMLNSDGSNRVLVGDTTNDGGLVLQTAVDIKWGKALVALGGGSAPTLGTIGGSGPATAAQNSWMRVLDSTGAAFFVPAWK